MGPGNRRFARTALAILGLMALANATVWIALFMFMKPAKGETVDARQVYVVDGDSIVLAREHIRLLAIDAPETRDARCERERVAGYETKARVVDLLRFGRSVDIHRHGHDQYGRTRSLTSSATASVSSSCARSWRWPTAQAPRRGRLALPAGAAWEVS